MMEVTLLWRMVKHDQGKEEQAPIHVTVETNTNVFLLLMTIVVIYLLDLCEGEVRKHTREICLELQMLIFSFSLISPLKHYTFLIDDFCSN